MLTETAAAEYFVQGNVVEGRTSPADLSLFNLAARVTLAKAPFTAPAVRTTSAEMAFDEVLAQAGATLPRRDAVDERLVREVRSRTGKIIDSQKQVGGWPEYAARR